MHAVVHLTSSVSAFTATEAQLARLRARVPGLELEVATSTEELLNALPRVELAIAWRFAAEWYALGERLRWVSTPAAGREMVAPDPRGKCQISHGAFHGPIIAESVLGMMLFMNRRLGTALRGQSAREWSRDAYSTSTALRGQTALIVGYGAIGRHLAALLVAVGMRVFGIKRDPTRGTEGVLQVYPVAELREALGLADHVVCVLPGDTGTAGLIGDGALAAMKPTAYLYNVGRGGAIDPDALIRALTRGAIAGAFLDVLPEEPPPPTSPLWTVPGLFLTPHASAIRADYLDLYFEELAGLIGAGAFDVR